MKQMLHELALAMRLIGEDRFAEAYKAMARISRIQAVMTLSWDVLSTLTPVDYLKFRDVLGTSSGFQSAQFREIEFRLGLKDPTFLDHYPKERGARARLQPRSTEPSLREAAHRRARARRVRPRRPLGRGARRRLARGLSRRRPLVRALRARREAGRHRRRAGDVAAQACADGRADHRQQARHRRLGRRVLSALDARQARVPGAVVAEDRSLSFKPLFCRSLCADPERLHFAAHSHHLWPDASFDGQVEAWNDAARLADRKWDKVMDEVWPEAQGHVARELGTGMPDAIVFSSNTHDFLIRLVTAAPRARRAAPGPDHRRRVPQRAAPVRALGGGGLDRGRNGRGRAVRQLLRALPRRGASGEHDLILVSQVLFGSGRMFDRVEELAALGRPDGPWVVIDGYHAFMALDAAVRRGGCADRFLPRRRLQICDGGRGLRLPSRAARLRAAAAGHRLVRRVRGSEPAAGQRRLRQGCEALPRRDLRPSALYRFNAVQRMLADNGLTTARDFGPCRRRCRRNCSTRIGGTRARRGRAAQPARRPAARALPRLPQPATRSAGTTR